MPSFFNAYSTRKWTMWLKVTARRIELPSKKMPCHLVSKKYRVTPHPARSGMSHGPRRRGRSMSAAACSGRYALGAGRLEARCGPDLLAIVSELPRSVYGSVVVATQPHSKESTPIHVIHFA